MLTKNPKVETEHTEGRKKIVISRQGANKIVTLCVESREEAGFLIEKNHVI